MLICGILLWDLWYQGNTGLIEWVEKCSIFFFLSLWKFIVNSVVKVYIITFVNCDGAVITWYLHPLHPLYPHVPNARVVLEELCFLASFSSYLYYYGIQWWHFNFPEGSYLFLKNGPSDLFSVSCLTLARLDWCFWEANYCYTFLIYKLYLKLAAC